MTITTISNVMLFIAGLWVSVAGFVGWYRFHSRALIIMGVGGFLVAGSIVLTILHIPGSSLLTDLALLGSGLLNLLCAGSWHRRGITARQLFLFAPTTNIAKPPQQHND